MFNASRAYDHVAVDERSRERRNVVPVCMGHNGVIYFFRGNAEGYGIFLDTIFRSCRFEVRMQGLDYRWI